MSSSPTDPKLSSRWVYTAVLILFSVIVLIGLILSAMIATKNSLADYLAYVCPWLAAVVAAGPFFYKSDRAEKSFLISAACMLAVGFCSFVFTFNCGQEVAVATLVALAMTLATALIALQRMRGAIAAKSTPRRLLVFSYAAIGIAALIGLAYFSAQKMQIVGSTYICSGQALVNPSDDVRHPEQRDQQ